jgi:hypothetical protein
MQLNAAGSCQRLGTSGIIARGLSHILLSSRGCCVDVLPGVDVGGTTSTLAVVVRLLLLVGN